MPVYASTSGFGVHKRHPSALLLIVGGHDDEVIELNREALAWLRCSKDLVVVPGATHLFSEPGTLEQAAQHAVEWFVKYLLH